MGTATQATQAEQLAAAKAAYAKAAAESDRLYAIYDQCVSSPAARDNARDAYLRADDATMAALLVVLQLQK